MCRVGVNTDSDRSGSTVDTVLCNNNYSDTDVHLNRDDPYIRVYQNCDYTDIDFTETLTTLASAFTETLKHPLSKYGSLVLLLIIINEKTTIGVFAVVMNTGMKVLVVGVLTVTVQSMFQ